MIWWVMAAMAQEPAEPVQVAVESTEEAPSDPAEAEAEAEVPEPVPATPSELLADGRRRLEMHDYLGARMLAQQALQTPGPHAEEALYLLGFAWEFDGQPGRSVPLYTQLLLRWPDGSRGLDARYRRAESLGAMGLYDAALEELDAFDGMTLDRPSQQKIRLLEAIWTVRRGKERKGLKRLDAALADCEEGDVSFYQAMAYTLLLERLVAETREHTMQGSQKEQGRDLAAWNAAAPEADRLTEKIILLREPHWTLQAMRLDGVFYENFGDLFLAASIQQEITADAHHAYYEQIAPRVEIVWVKGLQRYQRAAEFGVQVGYDGDRLVDLQRAQKRLQNKIEGL